MQHENNSIKSSPTILNKLCTYACNCGEIKTVKLMLEAGAANVNSTELFTSDYDLVKLLLDHGADVNCYDHSLLTIAIEDGATETTKLLLERGGAKLNKQDLVNAIRYTKDDPELVEMMLDHGASLCYLNNIFFNFPTIHKTLIICRYGHH